MALDFPASPTTGDRVTLNSVIYEFDGDKWVTIRSLFDRGRFVAGTAVEPGFSVSTDANTGLYAPGADQLAFTTGGVERVEFGTSEVVFNDGGIDYDFRIEGDADVNLVFADASTDRIGIGTSAPSVKVDIEATEPYVTLKNTTEEDTDGGREVRIDFEGEQSGGEASTLARIEVSHDGAADDEKGKVVISTNDGADAATPTTAVTIDSAQKVTIAGDLETNTINTLIYPDAGPLSNRNLIINGAMQVAQRGTSAIQVGTGTYTLDRFRGYNNTDGTFTVQQVADAPSGFEYSAKVLVTVADSTLASAQQAKLQQRIEGNVITQLGLGTSSAKTFTLSFYVKSSVTGTYAVGFINGSNNRSYVATYSINSANTWEYKTITVQGDTSGTWATDNTTGLNIQWSLGMGSDFEAAPDQWHASQESHTTSAVDLISTLNATWQLTGVQLEVGDLATSFEHRSYGDELARCQRYYYTHAVGVSSDVGVGTYYTNTKFAFTVRFPVTMRIPPDLDYESGSAYYAIFRNGTADTFDAMSAARTTENTMGIDTGTGTSGTATWSGLVSTNSASAYMAFDAEL